MHDLYNAIRRQKGGLGLLTRPAPKPTIPKCGIQLCTLHIPLKLPAKLRNANARASPTKLPKQAGATMDGAHPTPGRRCRSPRTPGLTAAMRGFLKLMVPVCTFV